MRKLRKFVMTFALLLLWAVSAEAQGIKEGSIWYGGAGQYEANHASDGTIRMYQMSEGEEVKWYLDTVDEQQGIYRIKPNQDPDEVTPAFAEENQGGEVRYKHQEGITVLCVYNSVKELIQVLGLTDVSIQDNTTVEQLVELEGYYSTTDANTEPALAGSIHIDVDGTWSVNGQDTQFKVQTFNGYAMPILEIKGSAWKGFWQFEPTTTGLHAFQVEQDEYGTFAPLRSAKYPNGREVNLTWLDQGEGRWAFTNKMIMSSRTYISYSKKDLRLMRNEILARHGYYFQSKDLQDYFAKRYWYNPIPDNSQVKLSFVEQLNVALIQHQEKVNE